MCRLNILVSILLVQFGLGTSILTVPAMMKKMRVAPSLSEPEAYFPSFPPADSPRFVTESFNIITAQIGSTAQLHCVIQNLGDYNVSWVRLRDYLIISSNRKIYSRNQRYRVVHNEGSEDWTLQINSVRQRDVGLYACEFSTNPCSRLFIELEVVDEKAEISGPPERYQKVGSLLRLVCTFSERVDPPKYVSWYHNNQVLNINDLSINVTSELEARRSSLVIYSAAKVHSGNYSCAPSNAQPASTVIHIINVL